MKKVGFALIETREINYFENVIRKLKKSDVFIISLNGRDANSAKVTREELRKYAVNKGIGFVKAEEMSFKFDVIFIAKCICGPGGMTRKPPLVRACLRIMEEFLFFSPQPRYLYFAPHNWQDFSSNVVLFPRGMDVGDGLITEYMKEQCTEFYAHGPYDAEIIERSTGVKPVIIGYPRYDDPVIKKWKNRRKKQKILFVVGIRNGWENLLSEWLKVLKLLKKKFDIQVRLHPSAKTSNRVIDNLTGFKWENDALTDLSNLYKDADIVLVDSGGSIFSALYNCNRVGIIALETKRSFPKKASEILVERILGVSQIRNIETRTLEEIGNDLLQSLSIEKTRDAKNLFFGNEKNDGVQKLIELVDRY